MIHEAYNLILFQTLFAHYLEEYQPESQVRFRKTDAKEIIPGMDWIMYLEGTITSPDKPDFVFHVRLYRNGSDPNEPRLKITYMMKWYNNLFDTEGKEEHLLAVLDAMIGTEIKLLKDGSFLFQNEFGILEDGHFSWKLFQYETEDDLPIELLLGNDEIVDPFLEETYSFFSEMQDDFLDILIALNTFMEKNREYLYERFLRVVDGVQFLDDDEFALAKQERDFAKAIVAEIEELNPESDPSYEQKVHEAIREIEENVTTDIRKKYLVLLGFKLV